MSISDMARGAAETGLKAVIFDLDGVLVTTDHFHFLGWKRLADELEMTFSETDNHKLRGVSRAESLKIMYRLNNRDLPDEKEFAAQMTRKNGYYVEFIGQMTPQDILPGSLELLESLKAASIKCAIASSSRNAGLVLERTGLDRHMDAVCDGNSISASKPDPEVFLRSSAMVGCQSWDCVGVEDAAAGIEAIKRAGMVALGVGDQAAQGDMLVGSVRDMSVPMLCELFSNFSKEPDRSVRDQWQEYAGTA